LCCVLYISYLTLIIRYIINQSLQALVEILLLSGGTPYANFKDLAHAWGREKGFHHVLANSICERRGEVERKRRSDAGRSMSQEQRELFKQKLRRTKSQGGDDDDDIDDDNDNVDDNNIDDENVDHNQQLLQQQQGGGEQGDNDHSMSSPALDPAAQQLQHQQEQQLQHQQEQNVAMLDATQGVSV
jgi:hypothetical protein